MGKSFAEMTDEEVMDGVEAELNFFKNGASQALTNAKEIELLKQEIRLLRQELASLRDAK